MVFQPGYKHIGINFPYAIIKAYNLCFDYRIDKNITREVNMQFPTMVYKSPGPHKGNGSTFGYISVKSEEEFNNALSNGYYETVEEAFAGKAAKKEQPIVEKVDTMSPPTRQEIEQKARELEIKFPHNISDENLMKKIEDKINELD